MITQFFVKEDSSPQLGLDQRELARAHSNNSYSSELNRVRANSPSQSIASSTLKDDDQNPAELDSSVEELDNDLISLCKSQDIDSRCEEFDNLKEMIKKESNMSQQTDKSSSSSVSDVSESGQCQLTGKVITTRKLEKFIRFNLIILKKIFKAKI